MALCPLHAAIGTGGFNSASHEAVSEGESSGSQVGH